MTNIFLAKPLSFRILKADSTTAVLPSPGSSHKAAEPFSTRNFTASFWYSCGSQNIVDTFLRVNDVDVVAKLLQVVMHLILQR
jgi:hypothetical protein